jgi:alpha-L-fucosidase
MAWVTTPNHATTSSRDQNWKSPADLVQKLVDCASKGGNYLLNVGPTAEGIIPSPSIERMHAVGDWLRANGESVYGTRPGPIQGLEWGRTTQRGGSTFLHAFEWPTDGVLRIPRVFSSAKLLQGGVPLTVRREGETAVIDARAVTPDGLDTVIVLE